MPGYEPFLLCDFHVHTTWSDGRLSVREVVDLYGQTGRFDVIAITDHILTAKDLLGRAGRMMSLGLREFSVTERRFSDYLADIVAEAKRARKLYDLLVIPGAEVTQNHIRARRNAHIVALNLTHYISADQPAEDILREIRRQGALSIACHPHHRTTRRVEIGTCYLWEHRKRLVDLVDVWEAANRDDLFSVTSLKHFPYVANSDFHKPKHLYSWKTLVRCEKNWEAIARTLRENVNVALTLYRNGSWIAQERRAGYSTWAPASRRPRDDPASMPWTGRTPPRSAARPTARACPWAVQSGRRLQRTGDPGRPPDACPSASGTA